MANKYNNELLPGYMDGIPVKISEKYKPPKRIILPTNTQRLTQNDINQSAYFIYDFSLAKLIKTRMKELREARAAVDNDRLARLKQLKVSDNINTDIKTNIPNTDSVSYPTSVETNSPPEIITNILMPITMANNSASSSSHSSCDTPTSTPINISDFENDTASPFDNMELKTLNDLAELAQVLQPINTVTPVAHHQHHYTTNFQNTELPNKHLNGFYSNNKLLTTDSSSSHILTYNTQSYNNYLSESHHISSVQSQNNDDSITCGGSNIHQTVPNIINSLQKELMHTHLDISTINERNQSQPSVSKQYELIDNKQVTTNPYSTLPARLQQICKEVSLMGFPLDRVARACAVIGDDQSKLIEHMIAMSQLLDLGFSEENITKALMSCDNDRDKALDSLVT